MLSRLKNRLANLKKANPNVIPNLSFDKFEDLIKEAFKEGYSSSFEKKLENISFEIEAYTSGGYPNGLKADIEFHIYNLVTKKKYSTSASAFDDYDYIEDTDGDSIYINKEPNYDIGRLQDDATSVDWKREGQYGELSTKELYQSFAKDIMFYNENPHENFPKK